jgi:chromosome segregation ATPase
MQEVLKKLDEGLSLLGIKLDAINKKETELKNAQKRLDDLMAKQQSAENNLRAKERLICKYEDLENEIKASKERKTEVNRELASAKQIRLDADNLLKSIQKQQEDVTERQHTLI